MRGRLLSVSWPSETRNALYVANREERINKLIEATARDPYAGIGKPEPLKHALSGFWSRRIDDEHRMVYRFAGDQLEIAQLRFHY